MLHCVSRKQANAGTLFSLKMQGLILIIIGKHNQPTEPNFENSIVFSFQCIYIFLDFISFPPLNSNEPKTQKYVLLMKHRSGDTINTQQECAKMTFLKVYNFTFSNVMQAAIYTWMTLDNLLPSCATFRDANFWKSKFLMIVHETF